jgi:hypothetical protein
MCKIRIKKEYIKLFTGKICKNLTAQNITQKVWVRNLIKLHQETHSKYPKVQNKYQKTLEKNPNAWAIRIQTNAPISRYQFLGQKNSSTNKQHIRMGLKDYRQRR